MQKIAVAGATGRVGRHIVDVLTERGHQVVPMSRASGVDVITGTGLAAALAGVDCVIDAATGPSPEQDAATEFFTTATRNLQEAGRDAGVQRIVVVSIVGVDKMTAGYAMGVRAHEQAMLAGPVPVRILRATQFHEFVGQMLEWSTRDDTVYMPDTPAQPVAARAVAEGLVDLATAPAAGQLGEIAGPRAESMVDLARLYVAARGLPLKVETADRAYVPGAELSENGALLPGPAAILAGPTFAEWLAATPG
jgi:uncharacterized protein YbjT (DUF2867 family)